MSVRATCPEAWDLLAGVAEASACWECCESESGWAANCSLPAGADACAVNCWTFVDAFYYDHHADDDRVRRRDAALEAGQDHRGDPDPVCDHRPHLRPRQDPRHQPVAQDGRRQELRERIDELHEVIDADDDGIVSMEEYILFNLKKMGKVDDDTIALLREQFNALDADGSGALDAGDIDYLQQACDMMGDGSKPPSKLGSPRRRQTRGRPRRATAATGPTGTNRESAAHSTH